jgi:hypothetical protein
MKPLVLKRPDSGEIGVTGASAPLLVKKNVDWLSVLPKPAPAFSPMWSR